MRHWPRSDSTPTRVYSGFAVGQIGRAVQWYLGLNLRLNGPVGSSDQSRFLPTQVRHLGPAGQVAAAVYPFLQHLNAPNRIPNR